MKKIKKLICSKLMLLSLSYMSFAQGNGNTLNRTVSITPQKIESAVTIDGNLNEPFWQEIDATSDFINQFPEDTGLADSQTSVKIAFDENYLYIGAICLDSSSDHIIRTLKRDNHDEYFGSDGLAIVLDPVNRKSSGFFFGVNAAGSQMEGLLRGGDFSTRLDISWNAKWKSEVSHEGSTWYIEMAIPFESLSYESSNMVWGVNFVRNDMKNNYFTTMVQVPRNLNAIDLGYVGTLEWNEPPPVSSKKNISLIPYVLGGLSEDFDNNNSLNNTREIGGDIKIGITSSLNLDLTVNPDFSTVEVDQQVTDLSRFSLFFPERRNFFVENSDLFNSFGIGSINPFFSRRIGLENGNPIPILFGSRLTGNATKNLRIGIMSVQTRKEGDSYSQNYSVAAFQQSVLARSSIRGLLVNRQSVQDNDPMAEYNRVAALEFSFLSDNGQWGGDLGLHKSFNPGDLNNEEYIKFAVRHTKRSYFTRFNAHRVGQNYITDVGFVPKLNNFDAERDTTIRRGFYQFGYLLGYNFYPSAQKINLHGPRLSSNLTLDLNRTFRSSYAGLFYFLEFANQNLLELGFRHEGVDLPFPSLIIGDEPFREDAYQFYNYGVWFRFDPRKKLSGDFQIYNGTFYNGNRLLFTVNTNYRVQPWGNFGIAYEFNDIRFPSLHEDFKLHLIGPKTELAFSRNIFWTTFLQYNTQIENFNINSRFQWRYSSLSDLFIVFTDNYNSENFEPKSRAVILKLNYWF